MDEAYIAEIAEQAAALARANHVPYLDVYNAAMSAYECSKGEDGL